MTTTPSPEGHTPGPWQLLEVEGHYCPATMQNDSILTLVEEDGVAFAVVYGESDAHLIAAAPDMFEALDNLVIEMRHMLAANPKKDGGLYRQRLIEAETALSKARGETP